MTLAIVIRGGVVRHLYHDAAPTRGVGPAAVTRASHVEPATITPTPGEEGPPPTGWAGWETDLTPSNGPVLGPFPTREAALAAEREWLTQRL